MHRIDSNTTYVGKDQLTTILFKLDFYVMGYNHVILAYVLSPSPEECNSLVVPFDMETGNTVQIALPGSNESSMGEAYIKLLEWAMMVEDLLAEKVEKPKHPYHSPYSNN